MQPVGKPHFNTSMSFAFPSLDLNPPLGILFQLNVFYKLSKFLHFVLNNHFKFSFFYMEHEVVYDIGMLIQNGKWYTNSVCTNSKITCLERSCEISEDM